MPHADINGQSIHYEDTGGDGECYVQYYDDEHADAIGDGGEHGNE